MAVITDKIDDIFWNAAQLPPGEPRERYLDSACAKDQELRQRVERLLEAQPKVDRFLEKPYCLNVSHGSGSQPTTAQPSQDIGMHIGPYKLLEQIGEGGM